MKINICKLFIILGTILIFLTACTPTTTKRHFSDSSDSGNSDNNDSGGNDTIPPEPPPATPISTLISNGWTAYNNNDLTTAETILAQTRTDYLYFYETYPPYWNLLGWITTSKQQLDTALESFSYAIYYDTSFDTTLADAHAGKAAINLIQNQYAAAIDSGEIILTIPPDYNPGHDSLNINHIYLLLAEAYYYNGDFANSLVKVQLLDPAYTNNLQTSEDIFALLLKIQELAQ